MKEESCSYPCRLDTNVVRKILETSGRKTNCDDSTLCDIKDTSYIFFVSRIIEAPEYCINRWNNKKKTQEINPFNFVYVEFDYVDYAILDSLKVMLDVWRGGVVVTNRCYNIKEGVLFK
jgi:hypothetical protein